MLLDSVSREATSHILPGIVVGTALSNQPLQSALASLLVAVMVRVTTHLVAKRRARRAARASRNV